VYVFWSFRRSILYYNRNRVLDEVYYTTTGTGPSDGAGTTIYSDNTGTVATGIVLLYSVGTNGAANVWFGTDGSGDIDGNGLQNC